jgi:ABC-type sugar transport system permease subunit
MASVKALPEVTGKQVALKRRKRWQSAIIPYLFIAPFFLSFLVFQFFPILFSGYLSLADWNGMSSIDFIGLQNWLNNPNLALPALIVMLLWAGLGWDALIITAGLRSIPDELYDAAKVDGASGWTEFRHITVPLLRPTLTFVLVTSVIFLWGLFAEPQLLTAGGPLRSTQTIALYLYEAGFRYHKFGFASAIAIALSLLMFVSSYLNFRLARSDVEY